MIDTEALRKKVIDLAIQGKLTEQLPEDGSAEDLYAQIQEEKEKLIKEGKIKKQKPLPEIEEDEIPFEIPKNWKWVRVADISYLSSGKPYEETEKGELYIKVSDMNLPENDSTISTSLHYTDKKNVGVIPVFSIIFPKRGGAIATNKKRTVIKQSIFIDLNTMSMSIIDSRIFWYVRMWFDAIVLDELQTGAAIPQINNKDIYPLLVPLPPLMEQKRIVELIDKIFEQIDIIDELQSKYNNDVEVLKSKVIDAATRGELTEQLPEDGNAEDLYAQILEEKEKLIKEGKIKKQKPLHEIEKNEIPFEIPENWRWVRISDVIDVRDGTHDSPKYHDEGIPLVTSKNISSGKLIFEDVKLISMDDAQKINERSYVDDGDILFAMIGSIGNPVIVHKDREFCIKNVALFKNFAPMHISMDYFYWFLMHEQFVLRKNAIGGLQPFVSLKVFRRHLMPLPPMSEQKRIAERLYELEDVVLEQEK